MSMSRWLACALFAFAVIGAYHAAKPKHKTATMPTPAPTDSHGDSLNTDSPLKRGIMVQPEPLKISSLPAG